MRAIWRYCLALNTWLACSTVLATALDTLHECAGTNAPPAQGLAALQAQCPDLETALTELGYADTLQEGWRETLTRDSLRDLVQLANHYQQTPASAAPDMVALPAILKGIDSEHPTQPKSWWQAFKEWLRSWYEDRPDTTNDSWLERLFSRFHPSADLTRVLVYILLGLVVVAAISVVINELRAAGLLVRRKKPAVTRGVIGALPTNLISSMPDLDSAALHDQPAILLRLLVAKLVATGRLSVERFLTHRELAARAAFASNDERERFAHVAGLAERMLYGPENIADEQLIRVVTEGRSLLQQLDTQSAAT